MKNAGEEGNWTPLNNLPESYSFGEEENFERIKIEDDMISDSQEILTIMKRYCEDRRIYLCEYLKFEDVYYFISG